MHILLWIAKIDKIALKVYLELMYVIIARLCLMHFTTNVSLLIWNLPSILRLLIPINPYILKNFDPFVAKTFWTFLNVSLGQKPVSCYFPHFYISHAHCTIQMCPCSYTIDPSYWTVVCHATLAKILRHLKPKVYPRTRLFET
jgi:hypothetical protein